MLLSSNKSYSVVIDILIALLAIKLLITWHSEVILPVGGYSLLQMAFVYFLMRLLFIYSPVFTSRILLMLIIILLIKELLLGILQLLTPYPSNHALYPITGSFNNPGPYGGFISICLGVLLAYTIKKFDFFNNRVFSHYLSKFITVLLFIAFSILLTTHSRSSILGIAGSALILFWSEDGIRKKIKPIIIDHYLWISLGMIVLVCGAYLLKKPSADGRFFMDKISAKAILYNTWRGSGIGYFGGAYGLAQEHYFEDQIKENGSDDLDWSCLNERERLAAECPDNAFNEFLQVGVENGLFIMLLVILIIVGVIIITIKQNIWCYGLMTLALFALFSYPMHVLQLQIMFAVLLASCLSDKRNNNEFVPLEARLLSLNKKKNYLMTLMVAIFFIGISFSIILNVPKIRQIKQIEADWKKIERWHQMEYYDYVSEECESLISPLKNNHRFLFAYGQSLNKIGMYEKSDSVLKIGTAISSDPMFWNVMGNNSLAMGKYREAEERYKHAFYMVPNRLYPLYLLAKLYYEEGNISLFLDMYRRIESFVPKVESTNTQRLRDELLELKNQL